MLDGPRRPNLPPSAVNTTTENTERIQRLERRRTSSSSSTAPPVAPDPGNPHPLSWSSSITFSGYEPDGDGWADLLNGHPGYYGNLVGPDWSLAPLIDFGGGGQKVWVYLAFLDLTPADPLDGFVQVRNKADSASAIYRGLSGGATFPIFLFQSEPSLNYFGLEARHIDDAGEVSHETLTGVGFAAGRLTIHELGPFVAAT